MKSLSTGYGGGEASGRAEKGWREGGGGQEGGRKEEEEGGRDGRRRERGREGIEGG